MKTKKDGVETNNGDMELESVPLRDEKSQTKDNKKSEHNIKFEMEEDEDEWGDEEEEIEVSKGNYLSRVVLLIQRCVGAVVSKIKQLTGGYLVSVVCLLGYAAYFIAAMIYSYGDEGSILLLSCTILGVVIMTRHLVGRGFKKMFVAVYKDDHLSQQHTEWKKTLFFFVRWFFYGLLLAVIVWILYDVGHKKPKNLRAMVGYLVFILICLLFSSSPGRINWHTVYWSIGIQFLCALFALKFEAGNNALFWMQDRLNEFFDNTKSASAFLFGPTYTDHEMVFGAFPLIFFVNAMMAALYYLGAMQFLIKVVGAFLSFVLETETIESMSVPASMLMEGILAILSLKPYLPQQSKSQLFVVISSTLSSLGSAYMAILSSMGIPLKDIIPAVLISAPATFTVCKLMVPETRPKNSKLNKINWKETEQGSANLMEAIQDGATSILPLIGNLIAMFFSFLALISWGNHTFTWFGDRVGITNLTMETILAYIMYPVALAMGIDVGECMQAGTLLGIRLISSNMMAFVKMSEMRFNRDIYNAYMNKTNFMGPISYKGDLMHLDLMNTTLTSGILTERTESILTYSLCGFSSFLSVSIILGIFYTILPQRRKWLTTMIGPALIAGNISNCMTGCFASLFY